MIEYMGIQSCGYKGIWSTWLWCTHYTSQICCIILAALVDEERGEGHICWTSWPKFSPPGRIFRSKYHLSLCDCIDNQTQIHGDICRLICELLQSIAGVPKIKEGSNPATWMLEITSSAVEAQLDVDFGEIFANSDLYRYGERNNQNLSTGKHAKHSGPHTHASIPCTFCGWFFCTSNRNTSTQLFSTLVLQYLTTLSPSQEEWRTHQRSEHPTTRVQGPVFSHQVLANIYHSMQSLLLETALVLLEEFPVQCHPSHHDNHYWNFIWNHFLEKGWTNVSQIL